MLLALAAAGFAPVPLAGRDCVELEHADKATEKTAMAVSRRRFNVLTFHEHSAVGAREGLSHGNVSPLGVPASMPAGPDERRLEGSGHARSSLIWRSVFHG
jgi:hypothetical protein